MISSVPQPALLKWSFNRSFDREAWVNQLKATTNFTAIVDRAILSSAKNTQDNLESYLELGYQEGIPGLVDAILNESSIKPTFFVLSTIYSKGTQPQLSAFLDRYKGLLSINPQPVIEFLRFIPDYRRLGGIVRILCKLNVPMRELVQDDQKYTLILTAQKMLFAQYWLRFLNPVDRKAEPLKSIESRWNLRLSDELQGISIAIDKSL